MYVRCMQDLTEVVRKRAALFVGESRENVGRRSLKYVQVFAERVNEIWGFSGE